MNPNSTVLLFGHSSTLNQSLITQLFSPNQNTLPTQTVWTIRTKYYEAEVEIKAFTLQDSTPSQCPCEAVLLLGEYHQPHSISQLQEWYQQQFPENEVSVSLLVLDRKDAEVEREWDEAVKGWCVEHGIEAIEISTTNSELEKQLSEDDQGLPRVKMALEAHIWPGHRPVTSGAPEPAQPEEDGFEKLISEMSNARDRFQRLPDDERREAAAQLALQLAQYFDDDEEEDQKED